MRFIASLRICHVHDDALEPAEQIDPFLAVDFAVIFPGNDRAVEYCLTTEEVKAMGLDVVQALCFVPSRYTFIVATNKGLVQIYL